MAGLKNTILMDDPVAFWSFDNDIPGLEGNSLIDEIDNMNPMIIQGTKYDLRQQSLNDLELVDQYSIKFAKDGLAETDWSDYATGTEVIHTTAFDFPNNGEFSIEFLYYKQGTTSSSGIQSYGKPLWGQNNITPLIQKGDMIQVWINDVWSGTETLNVRLFGTRTVTLSDSFVVNHVNHVVVRYKLTATDVNAWTSTISIYFNGVLVGSNSASHVDTYPITHVAESWKFFTADNLGNYAYPTELLTFDSFAIYDYALSETQIVNHYRKSRDYKGMVVDSRASIFYELADVEDSVDRTMTVTTGSYPGTYYGNIVRNELGPPRVQSARSTFFNNGGGAYVVSMSGAYYIAPFNFNQSYTVEFWFKTQESKQGTLLSLNQEFPNYNGLSIWINTQDGVFSTGSIEIMESISNKISVSGTWNDGKWHYLQVVRSGTVLSLFIDNEERANRVCSPVANGTPSQLHLMGHGPGNMSVTGNMSLLAFYPRALSQLERNARWLFSTRYKIFFYTKLNGNPIGATVRVYDHVTGELIGEDTSDSITGLFQFYPETNRLVDTVTFLPINKSVRYRAHGPILPAEFDDSSLG